MEKTLIRINVSDLIPYERNPRKIPQEAVDAVKESYRQCGVIDPIEIDENNVILSGHTRRLAAMELGIPEVDALRVSGLTEAQKRKYRILANKTSEKSGWDYDLLAEEIDDLIKRYYSECETWVDLTERTKVDKKTLRRRCAALGLEPLVTLKRGNPNYGKRTYRT